MLTLILFFFSKENTKKNEENIDGETEVLLEKMKTLQEKVRVKLFHRAHKRINQ